MKLTVKTINEGKITWFKVEGKALFEPVLKAMQDFYDSGASQHVLWDVSHGSLSSISSEQMWKLAQFVSKQTAIRPEGKSGILVGTELTDLNIAKEALGYAKVEDVKYDMKMFQDFDEAMLWLLSK